MNKSKIEIIKKGWSCYVFSDRVGYCAKSERRLSAVLKPYGVAIKVKKRPKVVILTKGQYALSFNDVDIVSEFIYDHIQGKNKREVTKLFKEKQLKGE